MRATRSDDIVLEGAFVPDSNIARIVDRAMEVSGGAGMFRSSELEQLFRDARCGRFHPANTFLVHEIVAKTTLGIDLGEQPRWG